VKVAPVKCVCVKLSVKIPIISRLASVFAERHHNPIFTIQLTITREFENHVNGPGKFDV